MADTKQQGFSTLALHAGYEAVDNNMSSQVPIFATSSYNFKDSDHAAGLFDLSQAGHIYSRLSNPTCDVLEQRLAALEGGAAALTFASGMAAISAAVLNIVKQGQNFVSSSSLYGGTYTLFTHTLKNLGIEVRFFDPAQPDKIAELIDENTRCVYLESQGNPKNDVADFEQVVKIAHDNDLPVLCDNTVLTPVMFRPIDYGVDIVLYSTTKYIGGHGAHIGGAIVDSGKFDWSKNPEKWEVFCKPDPSYHGVVFAETFENLAYIAYARTHVLRDMGAAMSPFAAWIFLIGLETLPLRMKQHCDNTQKIAEWLESHDCVDWVNYSGLKSSKFHENACKYFPNGKGAIIGFGIKGGKAAGVKFIDNVKLAQHLANIGDARTLVIHPASTTHQQLTEEEQLATGVNPEYIRLCVGIEDADDIIADLDQALKASQV